MQEVKFCHIVEDDFFLRKIADYFETESDLIYIGQENLAFLEYNYELQVEQYSQEHLRAVEFNNLSDEERNDYVDKLMDRGESESEIRLSMKYLTLSKAKLQWYVNNSEDKLACTKAKLCYLENLFNKRAKPKPVFASWRSWTYFQKGDTCVMLKPSYDPDAPIEDRFDKITIEPSQLHDVLIIDGRFNNSGDGAERPSLVGITSATVMLEKDFEFLRKHPRYRSLWIELEERAADTEHYKAQLAALRKAFD